jgi:hypothetical protein
MGGKLGTLFARAGHEVVFSYARSHEKLRRLAREANGNARAGTPDEAAKDADARNWLTGSSGLGNSMTNGALEDIQWSDVENRIGTEEL